MALYCLNLAKTKILNWAFNYSSTDPTILLTKMVMLGLSDPKA